MLPAKKQQGRTPAGALQGALKLALWLSGGFCSVNFKGLSYLLPLPYKQLETGNAVRIGLFNPLGELT